MGRFKGIFCGLLLVLLAGATCPAQTDSEGIRVDVKHFRLDNGMLFLVVERHTAPQVACRLAIRAGSALEDAGKTGIAHLLEHMMFKGTKNFGTLDVKKDLDLQKRIEAAYQVVLSEKRKRRPDAALIKRKLDEMARLRLEVQKIYVPQAFSSQLGRNGAVGVNAYTTKDQTQFMASVPSDMLEQWFSIISEQLFEPSWREFYVEKAVVRREWAYRYVNKPEGAAWLDLYAAAYQAHPYRNPTIGWEADMADFNTRDAMAFHRRFYNPANAVCVLVGDLSLKEARRLARIYFQRYPAGERAPEKVTEEPVQQGPRRCIRYLKGARTPLVRIGFHGARMGTRDFYALDAVTMLLSAGRSARLTRDVVDRGLAVEAWAGNPDNRYGGMFVMGGAPLEPDVLKKKGIGREEKRRAYLSACEELEKLLLAEAEKFKTEAVSIRELDRIRKLNRRDFLERLRSNEDLAGTLATLEVQAGWEYLVHYLDRIDAVTPADIRRAAEKYIRRDRMTTVYVIPGGKPERPPEEYREIRSVSGSAAARVARTDTTTNHSIYPTPEGWKHPLSFSRKPEKIFYPRAQTADVEGARVFYLPDRELPLVDLTLLVRAGSVDVPDGKTGLCGLINGSLIRGGAGDMDPSRLALALDENAIHLSVSFGREMGSIRLSVMKEDWERGLHLLKEVLTRPRFDKQVVAVVKREMLTGLRRQGGNARAVARREGMIWHFRGHPYGRDPLAGIRTIPGITRKDLEEFLKTYVVPSNMVAAVSGDIGRDRVLSGLQGLFRSLPGGKAPPRNLADPPDTPPVLTFINKPGQRQSQVFLFLKGLRRTNPDYWKAALLMDVFGGNDSLLVTRLRADLGLVYSAWFYQTYRWRAGMLMGYIGCKGNRTAQAISETVRLMDALRRDVPERELEQKRLDALNGFVFNVDTPAALVNVYGRYFLRHEPLDTLERIQDAFMGATRKDLLRLADALLDPGRLQVFVVGDREIRVKRKGGSSVSLEEDLKDLAGRLRLPFREIPLR